VNFNNLKAEGVTHRGDNRTGDGDGDDELIRIDLNQVPAGTIELFVVVNIFSPDV